MKYLVFLFVFLSLAFAQNPVEGLTGGNKANSQVNNALNSFFGEGIPKLSQEQIDAIDASVFSYKYNPEVSAKVRDIIIDSLKDKGVVSQTDIATLQDGLEQITPAAMQEFVDSAFAGDDFKADNMVDAISMYVIGSYVVWNEWDKTNNETDKAVRDVFKLAFARVPGMSEIPDEEKQLATELFMLNLLFMANDYYQAKAGKENFSLEAAREAALNNLHNFGLDPRLIAISEDGLTATELSKDIEAGKISLAEAVPDYYALVDSGATKAVLPKSDAAADTGRISSQETSKPKSPNSDESSETEQAFGGLFSEDKDRTDWQTIFAGNQFISQGTKEIQRIHFCNDSKLILEIETGDGRNVFAKGSWRLLETKSPDKALLEFSINEKNGNGLEQNQIVNVTFMKLANGYKSDELKASFNMQMSDLCK